MRGLLAAVLLCGAGLSTGIDDAAAAHVARAGTTSDAPRPLPADLAVPVGEAWQEASRRRQAAQPAARPKANAQRFDMTQGGKRMSADDFDRWMKSRGIRVATGKPKSPPRRAAR